MGTTVTTNLGLIKPDVNESIKQNLPTFAGWASQNGTNCDKIDALFRAQTSTWSLAWTATSVNPTLGSGGFLEGKYVRLLPRLVIGYFRIAAGAAGFAAGTGQYNLSIPAAMDPTIDAMSDSIPIGKAVYFDTSSTLDSSAFEVHYSTVTKLLFLRPPGANAWTNTNPTAFAQGDAMSGYFIYPTAAA